MNKLIILIFSMYSLSVFADSSNITSVATWKAVAIKDSTTSKNGMDISSSGAVFLVSDKTSASYLSSGEQNIYTLPLKQDIPEYKLFTKVISSTLSNKEQTAELEVNVLYGQQPITKNKYQQILISDTQNNFSFKAVNADHKDSYFDGNVDVDFVFYWEGSAVAAQKV